MDDLQVIERIRAGDSQAFEQLVRHYQRPLFHYLGRMGLRVGETGIWDAWQVARRSTDYRPAPWQHPAIYLALVLFAYISVIGNSTSYIREHLVESFRIPSNSMKPNVLQGDFLFADKRVNCPGCKHSIQRGDIAIFVYPNNRTLREALAAYRCWT